MAIVGRRSGAPGRNTCHPNLSGADALPAALDIIHAPLDASRRDQYAATLGSWMGVADSELLTICPT